MVDFLVALIVSMGALCYAVRLFLWESAWLANRKKEPDLAETIWASVTEQRANRTKWRALEAETMAHWEKMCMCPTPEMTAAEEEQREMDRRVDEALAVAKHRYAEYSMPALLTNYPGRMPPPAPVPQPMVDPAWTMAMAKRNNARINRIKGTPQELEAAFHYTEYTEGHGRYQ